MENLTSSEKLDLLLPALTKAQKKIKPAIKNVTNNFLKTEYADLASVSEACRTALNENGFAVVQSPYNEGERIGLETTIYHESGQFIRSRLSVILSKNDTQATGSIITYLRRYQLAALAGVIVEDDDAEGSLLRGSATAKAAAAARPPTAAPVNKLSDYTKTLYKTRIAEAIDAVMLDHIKAELEKVCRAANDVGSFNELKAVVVARAEELKK